MMYRTRLQVEALEDRTVPSAVVFDAPPALAHLAVAVQIPVDPIAPVFVLNFGTPSPETLPALHGLLKAQAHIPSDPIIPPNPISPVFFGLLTGPTDGGDTFTNVMR
jgi:hypothetical protein